MKTIYLRKILANARHHIWTMLLPDGTLKIDDGESGSRNSDLRNLERHIIEVTPWLGGTKLGGDRFRRVQDAVRVYLDDL